MYVMCMGLWAFNQYQYTSKDYYCLKVLKISSYTMITENLLKNNISNPLWHKRERESPSGSIHQLNEIVIIIIPLTRFWLVN